MTEVITLITDRQQTSVLGTNYQWSLSDGGDYDGDSGRRKVDGGCSNGAVGLEGEGVITT